MVNMMGADSNEFHLKGKFFPSIQIRGGGDLKEFMEQNPGIDILKDDGEQLDEDS